MRVEKVAQLVLEHEELSMRLIDLSLSVGAPMALDACRIPAYRCSRMDLTKAIAKRIREFLDVGIPELIVRDWLPARARGFQPMAFDTIELAVRSELVREVAGMPTVRVNVNTALTLTQGHSRCIKTHEGCGYLVGEERAWHAQMSIAASDVAAITRQPFYRCERDIYLPRQAWPQLR